MIDSTALAALAVRTERGEHESKSGIEAMEKEASQDEMSCLYVEAKSDRDSWHGKYELQVEVHSA